MGFIVPLLPVRFWPSRPRLSDSSAGQSAALTKRRSTVRTRLGLPRLGKRAAFSGSGFYPVWRTQAPIARCVPSEPLAPNHHGKLAQWVERQTQNLMDASSNLAFPHRPSLGLKGKANALRFDSAPGRGYRPPRVYCQQRRSVTLTGYGFSAQQRRGQLVIRSMVPASYSHNVHSAEFSAIRRLLVEPTLSAHVARFISAIDSLQHCDSRRTYLLNLDPSGSGQHQYQKTLQPKGGDPKWLVSIGWQK